MSFYQKLKTDFKYHLLALGLLSYSYVTANINEFIDYSLTNPMGTLSSNLVMDDWFNTYWFIVGFGMGISVYIIVTNGYKLYKFFRNNFKIVRAGYYQDYLEYRARNKAWDE